MTGHGDRRRAIQAHLAGLGLPTEGVASGTGSPLPVSGGLSGMPMTSGDSEGAQRGAEGVAEDGLARLLAFRFGVPPVEGERAWAELSADQRDHWHGEAEMVLGYLMHGLGWTKPQAGAVDTAVTADQEGPEQGHTFRLEAHSRGSYGLMAEGDPAPHDYRDADWFGEPPLTLEVRAWNLRDALLKAARISLPEWRHEGRRLVDG